ncbi:MAG: Spy/CpxP family protein refolding chaperone [Pirellulales bacterium]
MKFGTIGICLVAAVLAGATGATGLAATGSLGDDVPEARPLRMLVGGQLGRLLTLRSELDVTAEQRDKIRGIVRSHKAELVSALRPIAEKRRALRDATLAENANDAAIRAAANELGKTIGDAAVVGSKIKAEVRTVLTPEQREKVDQFRQQSESAVDKFLDQIAAGS